MIHESTLYDDVIVLNTVPMVCWGYMGMDWISWAGLG